MFSAPIPGQSLTSEPKNYAWENPVKYTNPEDALLWHMERLDTPKRIKAVIQLLELGLDVVTMTEGIARNAVAEGIHTIDTSLIISPVIHEFITGVADVAGIDYDEGLEEEELDDEEFKYAVRAREAEKILAEIKEEGSADLSDLEETQDSMPMMDEEEPVMEEEPVVEEKPIGLMARGAV